MIIMRFRTLTYEELKLLEDEFKHFLIVNHLYKEEWESLNARNPQKAQEIVALFSDTVLEKVYHKINFLELRTPYCFSIYHNEKESVKTIQIQSPDKKHLLEKNEEIEKALNHHYRELDIYFGNKKYEKTKADFVFELLEQGCQISNETVWHAFSSFIGQGKTPTH